MNQHAYFFNPPRWQPARPLYPQTGALFAGSAIWLTLYGWLGYRLWTDGITPGITLNLALIGVCIVLGVLMVWGWRTISDHWLLRLQFWRRDRWSGLSLAELQALSPGDFEEYVTRYIFERQGYRAINTPDVKDGGIDVLVFDDHGQQAVVQCKRYKGTVGEPVVRDLYGTMIGNGATYAYLITTGEISAAAQLWARGKPIELIDGPHLVQLGRTVAGH